MTEIASTAGDGADSFEALGTEIRAAMRLRNMSVRQVSQVARYDHAAVSRALRGDRFFSSEMAERLQAALDVETEPTWAQRVEALNSREKPPVVSGEAEALLWLASNTTGEDAEMTYRTIADLGNRDIMIRLVHTLITNGNMSGAESAARLGLTRRMLEPARTLVDELERNDRAGDVEMLLRAAIDAGDNEAYGRLAALRARSGDMADAERLLRLGSESGNFEALTRLVDLLLEAGDGDEAERLLRQAADSGRLDALTRLVDLLSETGRREEAKRHLRQAADRGDAKSMVRLAELLLEDGDRSQAERQLRRAVALGESGTGIFKLLELRAQAGDLPEAQNLLRRAVTAQAPTKPVRRQRAPEPQRAIPASESRGVVVTGSNNVVNFGQGPSWAPLPPDPTGAVTTKTFVEHLQLLLVWAGSPSMRQLEVRSRNQLRRSTISDMLRRTDRLPKRELVQTFVSACGAASEWPRWDLAWQAIAFKNRSMRTAARRRATASAEHPRGSHRGTTRGEPGVAAP
jgi:tetratricopeptide (TPR) repeat protein